MPEYQVQSKVNGQTVVTELEADNTDNVLSFYSALSVADVMQVRKYKYINPSKVVRDFNRRGRYATVTIYYKFLPTQKLKIPDLKPTVSEQDIINYIQSINTNVSKITVNIRGVVLNSQ